MTVKTKLSLGLGFLFLVILLQGGIGSYYLYQLATDSKKIIRDNYESLVYAKNMTKALNELTIDRKSSLLLFEENLIRQEHNITEQGEAEITLAIRNEYNTLISDTLNFHQLLLIRNTLQQLTDLNLQAIVRKNELANQSSETAIFYMSIIFALAILISFTFIIGFPKYIANPIRELTKSIREIANKNYKQRVHFKSYDEFGELATAFNTMAEKLDDYESSNLAQIIFQKKRIEAIINTIHDPIIGMDENNHLLFVNKDACSILGISEKNLIGKYAPDIALTNDLLRVLLKNESKTKPLKIFFQDRESYFIKELLDITAENKRIGKAIILKNITEFKELDSAKTDFIATISHELKTPIASIKMGLTLLEDERIGSTNEEQKKLLAGINEDSQRLLKITGELLDLTQVESGKINLDRQLTDPKEIAQFALEAIRFQAEQKQLHVEFKHDAELPKLNLDKEKTTWVLINLLSNAIRYSQEENKILIQIRKDEGKVIFSVQDFGKGIDSKYKDKIFEKYFKIPDGNLKGTGLGLAISKEFIEAQSGSITVRSTPGKGSTFDVTFQS